MKNFIVGGKNNFLQTCWYEFNGECSVWLCNGVIAKTEFNIAIIPDLKFEDEEELYYIFLEKELRDPWEVLTPIHEPLYKVMLHYYLNQEVYYNLNFNQQSKLYDLLEKTWISHAWEDILKKCIG